MKVLNTKFRITLGQTGLIVSLVMLAVYLGIVPDRIGAVRDGRASLAEALAVYTTALVMKGDIQRMEGDLSQVVERNADLLSLALRRADGHPMVIVEDHDGHWNAMPGEYSTNSQVRVPIWAGDLRWGQLELRFMPLAGGGTTSVLRNSIVQIVLFMGFTCFVVFYFYLGKVLRHLDPSQAIPGRVRAALDTMAEGLLILDHKEQIVLANLSFANLLGKSPDDLLGCRAWDLPWMDIEGNQVDKPKRPWVQALDQGKVQRNCMLRLRLQDGGWRTFNINCSPVLGAGSNYAGVLASFDDVTQLEEKEVELRKSKEEAETANRTKSAFLANMSHEIRTPMNAILGFTEILKRGYVKNEKESLRYLNTIHSSGKNLLELINDILDLSKVESGSLEVEKIWVEPYQILHEVLQTFSIKAQEKGIRLGFIPQGALPQKIETDPARLRQIVYNTVGNSIKFTDEGAVTVTCRYDKTAAARLVIQITDTGIGIPHDRLDTIFDPFVQADTTVTRRFGGTGLGLSISRKLARALGGNIIVESKAGEGSTFTVNVATGDLAGVPFLESADVAMARQESSEERTIRWQFSEARILVVDDAPENREFIRLVLEEAGLSVDEAENGSVGVEKAVSNRYDVILMDVQMPVMDGFAATQTLRQQGVETSIIALTANAMKGFEQQCLERGYSGYLTKPIDVDRFMELMGDLLDGQPLHGRTDSSAASVALQESAAEKVHADGSMPILSKLPGNNEKFRALIARFVSRLHEKLGALDRAGARGDFEEVAALAHWLKGASGTVGFDEFTAPASKLEGLANECREPEVSQAIASLHALAARIVIPGSESPAFSPGGNSSADETFLAAAEPAPHSTSEVKKQVVSRLADNPKFQKTIVNFVIKVKEELEKMEYALKQGDMAELARLAHWLKGSGGTVGYDDFTEPAAQLEHSANSCQAVKAREKLEHVKTLVEHIVLPIMENDLEEELAFKEQGWASGGV
jgi:PAS domain S-box-containing protein